MSEAHTREVLELKANSSQELDTMTEEHIKEKEEVQRENAARLERETGALKRQLAMETGVLTTQLEAMQTAMENELAEERSQIDLTKQKWAAELANLEAETVKTEAERQVCQDAMRKDFEDRDAFIVRIEEELRARTEVIPSPLTVSVSEQTSAGWRAAERRHPADTSRSNLAAVWGLLSRRRRSKPSPSPTNSVHRFNRRRTTRTGKSDDTGGGCVGHLRTTRFTRSRTRSFRRSSTI